ncbi:MAG: hypothetical protein R3246_05770 [Acidimicrobiia bacterium]|nr:hypothetical protein [Acidimicrobiia bacterium]
MIDLDARARHAVKGLKTSVAEAELTLTEAPSARAATRWSPAFAMAAGALTALVLLLGVWTLRPPVVADDLETTTTTVTTTTSPTTTVPTTVTTTADPAVVPPGDAPSTTLADTIPPSITIDTPFDGQVFETDRITFMGTTEPGARVFGGPYEATVDADGNWSIVLILSKGSNRATFTAIDAAGNEASANVTAIYEPVSKTTVPPKPPEKEPAPFVAHATWLECAEDPPYDEYYGTGEPGSTVMVVSEWGSGDTTVGSDGSWYVKVFFPKAPKGVAFDVKVKDSLGRYQYFSMKATA